VNDQIETLAAPVRLQYVEALRLAAYQSFNDRRSYEWKLSLAIWTALAVLVAGLVQPLQTGEVFPLHGRRYEIGAAVFGALVMLLHVYFNNCLARANTIDRKKVLNYTNHIESALKLANTDLTKEIARRIDKLPKYPRHGWMQRWNWGHLVQIAMTALLAIVAVAILSVRVTA